MIDLPGLGMALSAAVLFGGIGSFFIWRKPRGGRCRNCGCYEREHKKDGACVRFMR